MLAGGVANASAVTRTAGRHVLPIVCHDDVCSENAVFRDGGVAVALLDFAAPGRSAYDLAQMARTCVPVDDDADAARLGWAPPAAPADRPARLRLVADACGLDGAGRRELVAVLADSIALGGEFVRRRVEAGDPNFTRMWNELEGAVRFDRRRRWWDDNEERFARAVR